MTPAAAGSLRRAAAHVLVDDVDAPALEDRAGHHLFRVLRIRDGEIVTVTDGAGHWRECRAAGRAIEPVADRAFVERRPDTITVAFAIPKQDRPEWIVQKLTEFGVDRIVLLHADRSIVRWDPERATRHLTKLDRVAAEALQQSRGVWLPTVEGPRPSVELLPRAVAAEPGGRRLAPVDRTVAIGPEGGWSPEELAIAADRVTLGLTVLRVETAVLAAASRMIQHVE